MISTELFITGSLRQLIPDDDMLVRVVIRKVGHGHRGSLKKSALADSVVANDSRSAETRHAWLQGAGYLSWLRDEVDDLYCADNDRPGIDPEVAVRLMLAGLLLGIVHADDSCVKLRSISQSAGLSGMGCTSHCLITPL
jgi:hypothetical protein